jgi:hypothetical protein
MQPAWAVMPAASSHTKVDFIIVGPTRGAAECLYDQGLQAAFE